MTAAAAPDSFKLLLSPGQSFEIAVLGGGPVGVEAALRSVSDGYRTVLIERGEIGQHARDWGHVRMFTPWSMNTTDRGRSLAGPLPSDDCPTGEELARDYLQPIVRSLQTQHADRFSYLPHAEVTNVRRVGWPKRSGVGSPLRAAAPFEIDAGSGSLRAAVVVDATGTVPPTPDQAGVRPGLLTDAECESLREKRCLLIGTGASAATDARRLIDTGVEVTILSRSTQLPFAPLADDPLPNRRDLFAAVHDRIDTGDITVIANVATLRTGDDATASDVTVGLRDGTEQRFAGPTAFDCLIDDTGRTPDLALVRDLQVHLCYATEGPMKLAAHLMSEDAAAGDGPVDCLAQSGSDADLLRTTEPGFFMLGAKSYGRRSNFLLRAGLQQADAAFDTLVPEHLERLGNSQKEPPA